VSLSPIMSLSKQRISSPLEAGPSILDAYNLPSHLNEALEYTSKRLARKALHITLVVVRKEYQLPSFGIRLIQTSLLSPKAEKTLRTTILKAERKFRIGTSWLPPAATASACGLNEDLVRRSMLQNEVLFSSEGLTLLGLDRLYSFKSALAVYARSTYGTTASPSPATPAAKTPDSTRLEDAVDALRRLVLANGGRPISKSDLLRSYDWLGVNSRALKDVESMYKRAYGGPERTGAFEITRNEQRERGREVESKPVVIKLSAPPPPKTPPRTQTTPSQRLGPLTPNGYDDISPVTRGEWGFLFKGEGWQQGRTAAVETW
ncbi:hypothetical protein K445DRAFT_51468, partial [Daldinia sp. EC12]